MPIIARVGRKSLRVRILIGLIYAVLITGSVTMVYPFAIMVSGSFKSPVDEHDYDIIPRYFYDDNMLFRKYVEERHNESIQNMNALCRTSYTRFEDVYPPAVYSPALLADWRAFLESDCWDDVWPDTAGRIPISFFSVGSYTGTSFRKPWMFQAWLKRLQGRFGTIERMNREWRTNYPSFLAVWTIGERWDNRRYSPQTDLPIYLDFVEMKRELRRDKPRFLVPISGDGLFLNAYLWPKCTREIQAYNKTHGTCHASYADVVLSERVPPSPRSPEEWEDCVADERRLRNVRLRDPGKRAFREFLLDRYGSFEAFADAYHFKRDHVSQFGVPQPVAPDPVTPILEDYAAFIRQLAHDDEDPPEEIENRKSKIENLVYLLTVEDWSQYVRKELHIQNIRLTRAGEQAFRDYLLAFYTNAAKDDPAKTPLAIFIDRYGNDVLEGDDTQNRKSRIENRKSQPLAEVLARFHLPQPVPLGTPVAVDFSAFIATECPLDEIRLVTLDILFARYLEKAYGDIASLNKAARASLEYPLGSRGELVAGLSPLGRKVLEVLVEQDLENANDIFGFVDDALKARAQTSRSDDLRSRIENRKSGIENRKSKIENPLHRLGLDSVDHLKLALNEEDRALLCQIRQIDAFVERPFATFRAVPPQEYARDWDDLKTFKKDIKREFIVTNYRVVLDFILFHGRALFNTAVLVLSMITCSLTINPLAAYALSRFQLPSTYKVLLFFMATMAFPAEVTMIPNFLLLKNFPLGYLIQGAIFFALFFLGQQALSPHWPRLWKTIEAVLMFACIALVTGAVILKNHALLAGTDIVPNSFLAYVLVLFTALAISLLVISHFQRRPKSKIENRKSKIPWLILIAVFTITTTPIIAKALGFGSPFTSLLNTFFALILPTMANGYAIFLLKGFFDSLPQTLYESAQIEGANEAWMFTRITIPLSKPILAVIALQTFNIAYMTFMYAFIVCQDESMWTLMVWLYEMQIDSPQFVVFAGLVISAIPTLFVFVLAQRVIMRGIIIPVEK